MSPRDNIIVDSGKAKSAKDIKEVRNVLGILVSDNLVNAENILVVEGEEDKLLLSKLLPKMSEKLSKSMRNNTFIIDEIGGAGNLSYQLSLHRNNQCKYHVFLDDDEAGRSSSDRAIEKGYLDIKGVTNTVCAGAKNFEIEDLLDKRAYEAIIKNEFGVSIDVKEFRDNAKVIKWSDRIKNCFISQGKQWNDRVENKLKMTIAQGVSNDPDITIDQKKRSVLDALVKTLEEMM